MAGSFHTMNAWLNSQQAYNTAIFQSTDEWTAVDRSEGTKSEDAQSGPIIVGYEQGTDRPILTSRTLASELFPRHADYLHSAENPYRLPGIGSGVEASQDLTGDGYEFIDVVPSPLHKRKTSEQSATLKAAHPPPKESLDILYMDSESLARLEGNELFAEPSAVLGWPTLESEQVKRGATVSRFSDESDPPKSRSAGLFRSFSNRVKGVIHRRPSAAHARHPNREVLPPDLKAIPIKAPCNEVRRYPALTVQQANRIDSPAVELRGRYPPPTAGNSANSGAHDRYPHARRVKRSKSKRSPPSKPPAGPLPQIPGVPGQVTVLGHPDRVTKFSDFIDFEGIDEAIESSLPAEDEDFSILDIKPLPPKKAVSRKKVDRSRDWIPPDSPTLPNLPYPTKVTSTNWGMEELATSTVSSINHHLELWALISVMTSTSLKLSTPL
jgi:hypothetical protein